MRTLACVFLLLLTPVLSHAKKNMDDARGVVLFLGDGMGISTVTAARILAGQIAGGSGEEHALSFESFDNVALIKTYNLDRQVADSAGTMTAIVTGHKANFGAISVAPSAPRGSCKAALAAPLTSLLERAESAGYSTGIVSTARITHATPAATYAHVTERDWENDGMLSQAATAEGCRDIARQLAEFDIGDGPEVILGGGRANFLPREMADPEYPQRTGARKDGADLTAVWSARGDGRRYIWNSAQLAALTPGEGQVMGLFEPSHMQYEADRAQDAGGEPSIADMTRFAIASLQARGKPFFLMVEAGRIDHGHHAGNAYRALHDTLALDAAVQVAVDMLDPQRSLVLVTADHSHTFTISGYPRRGNPILGKAEAVPGMNLTDANGRPYPILGYANGPGFREDLPDLSEVDTESADFRQLATVPMPAETHAGEDVAAYARGVGAHLVRGVMEQNRLYEALYMGLFGKAGR